MRKRYLIAFILLAWIVFIGGVKFGSDGAKASVSSFHQSILHIQPDWSTFWSIVPQNVVTAGVIFVGSMLTLGLIGNLILFFNGMFVGGIIVSAQEGHLSNATIFLSLIPHGIFEISSLGLTMGIGTWCSYQLIAHWFFHAPWPSKKQVSCSFYQLLSAFLLLIFAGIIESFITPLFLIHK